MDWVSMLQRDIEANMSDAHLEEAQLKYKINPPQSKEECLYRDLFQEFFPGLDRFVHVWEGGCRAGGASWKSSAYTRFGLCDVNSLKHGLMSETDMSSANWPNKRQRTPCRTVSDPGFTHDLP